MKHVRLSFGYFVICPACGKFIRSADPGSYLPVVDREAAINFCPDCGEPVADEKEPSE